MRIVLSLIGMVGAFYMMYYRQKVGDMIGEADWMRKVGGVYNVIVFAAVFIFFWCIAELTGTTGIFFRPLTMLFPGSAYRGGGGGMEL
jgi:hypothetical protein